MVPVTIASSAMALMVGAPKSTAGSTRLASVQMNGFRDDAWATGAYSHRLTSPSPNARAWVNEDISYWQTMGVSAQPEPAPPAMPPVPAAQPISEHSGLRDDAWATDAYSFRLTSPRANERAWVNEDISYLQTTRASAQGSNYYGGERSDAWATDAYSHRLTAPAPNERAWVNEDISYVQTTGAVVPTQGALAAAPANMSEE